MKNPSAELQDAARLLELVGLYCEAATATPSEVDVISPEGLNCAIRAVGSYLERIAADLPDNI